MPENINPAIAAMKKRGLKTLADRLKDLCGKISGLLWQADTESHRLPPEEQQKNHG